MKTSIRILFIHTPAATHSALDTLSLFPSLELLWQPLRWLLIELHIFLGMKERVQQKLLLSLWIMKEVFVYFVELIDLVMHKFSVCLLGMMILLLFFGFIAQHFWTDLIDCVLIYFKINQPIIFTITCPWPAFWSQNPLLLPFTKAPIDF